MTNLNARPITDHVYQGGNQIGDTCNYRYYTDPQGWPQGTRCATRDSDHIDRHPQQVPYKDTLPS